MAKTSIYLNFQGNCEEAFNTYKKIFNTDFVGQVFRMKDSPPMPNAPKLSDKEANLIMNIGLPILGGTVIMGTDMLESMGHKLRIGNNTTISLEADTKEEVDRLYKALSEGGSEMNAPMDMFWGYWGVCLDRFGIRWMFNCMKK
ncbi:MAG TPA: VOC family protein [Bacteroidia bacterium]|jgi:PhnB protein|nr:VOC family protein [Bacteroidia bacterium]